MLQSLMGSHWKVKKIKNSIIILTLSPKPLFDLKGKIKLQLHTFLPMMSWKCMLTAWSTDCSASKVINPKPSQRPRVNQGSRGVVTTQDEEQYWASAEWGSVKTEQDAPGVRMMSQNKDPTLKPGGSEETLLFPVQKCEIFVSRWQYGTT